MAWKNVIQEGYLPSLTQTISLNTDQRQLIQTVPEGEMFLVWKKTESLIKTGKNDFSHKSGLTACLTDLLPTYLPV